MTPKDVILRRGTLSLYHYRPMADEIYRVPLLMVMATTNRGYIFDLAPGQSIVEFLLKQGYDVFVIDWNAADAGREAPALRGLRARLHSRMRCACVQERSGEQDVTLLRLLHGRRALDHVRRAAPRRPDEEPGAASPRRSTSAR